MAGHLASASRASRSLTPVLNVLVNNSGATWGAPLEEYPDQAFTKLFTLNVQRVFTLTQALLPMIKKGADRDAVGRIINVSWSVWEVFERGYGAEAPRSCSLRWGHGKQGDGDVQGRRR